MKITSVIIIILLVVLLGCFLLIFSQDKAINELQAKPDTLKVIKKIPMPPDTIRIKVPVDTIDLEKLKAKWKEEHPPEIIELIDTLWLYSDSNKTEIGFADLDTTIENMGKIKIRYYLPPISYFWVRGYPVRQREILTITKAMPPRKWGFTTTLLAGAVPGVQSYRVQALGALYFKDVGIAATVDSDGLWLLGLSKRW